MHIGNLIKQQLEEQGRTVVWFARKLSCSRTNVYKIFEKPSIDTNLLLRISSILNYDFFKHYTEYFKDTYICINVLSEYLNLPHYRGDKE